MIVSTLTTLETALSAATTRAREAWAALSAAQQALGPGATQADVDRMQLASQRAQIAAHDESVARWRLARYRIAALGWHKASREDRAVQRPGAAPWPIEKFAKHHGISLTETP